MSARSSQSPVINARALEPLFAPWEEPNAHRVRSETPGEGAKTVKGRRPSPVLSPVNVNSLRSAVRDWRETFYAGASDTTRELLNHWFERPHRMKTPAGDEYDFRYFFCQREAIETLVFLKEVRRLDCLSQIIEGFGGPDAEIAALGIRDEEDAWSRYAFKLATGAGKTKVMSLAIVWSYFHALRESDSDMARHFVVVAPNLTVYERLKEDFGDGRIFDTDPLIPVEWKGDWNMSVVLQDSASGATTGGVIYLTNIHRLYDKSKRKKEAETYAWAGPSVSKAKALDVGAELRDRITAHRRVMVLNDEAHHLWDPDSAWNDAITYLHETIKARTGGGIVGQLDFTATPKDNMGQMFKHIVCDTPLGEAVDAGIVKTPIIGRSEQSLSEDPSDNAAFRYDRHLRLGYERWRKSRQEWDKSGKKALLFVMCEDTESADQITQRLNTDDTFKELNGKTINLHTNLKGKMKTVGRGPSAHKVFVEDEKEISDEDLKTLRELSRQLDQNASPYFCIVSVLMLREGWDVRNVTTIVPLRPYSSKANILPEQTLGRGLRRMTPPGTQGANEIVAVIEHHAFASLYQQELSQEGLPLEIVDITDVPATTISIYPDTARKDLKRLEMEIPRVTGGYRVLPKLEGLTIDDVQKEFGKYTSLPLGSKGPTEIKYEGRHLLTNEVIERMKIDIPLLSSGIGAVSYYVKQLEQICKVRAMHGTLAPLLQTFIEEVLFNKKSSLFDADLIARLGDPDVAEHIRAVFVPLIQARTTRQEQRTPSGEPMRLSEWKPYQVTHSERRPALEAARTLFNLVPCNRHLEVAMSGFLDSASGVAAFAKNAGPQCLRIDYLSSNGRLAFYTPDFFVRAESGTCYMVETKGREDLDVPRKAKAAVEWCKSSTKAGTPWEYMYVSQEVFERMKGGSIEELARTCAPSLQTLIRDDTPQQVLPLFADVTHKTEEETDYSDIITKIVLDRLPPRYGKAVEQAIMLFRFMQDKPGINFAPVFNALLGAMDEAAKGLILRKLQSDLPTTVPEQKAWLAPYMDTIEPGRRQRYKDMAQNLKRTLVFNNGLSPVGLLRVCLDYALNDKLTLGGVFEALKAKFQMADAKDLLDTVAQINDFRNTYIAHQDKELTDASTAEHALRLWVGGLAMLSMAE